MSSTHGSDKFREVRQEVDRLNSESTSAATFMDSLTRLLQEKMLKYN